MKDELVPVRRYVDAIVASGSTVRVYGWIFAIDGSVMQKIGVATHPPGLARLTEVNSQDSRDVAEAHPGHEAARTSRFEVVLELATEALNDGYLIELRPTFNRGFGRRWHLGSGLPSVPEDQVNRVGGGQGVGLEFLDYFVDYAGITAAECVLDFGCGTGRMALPLSRFLGPQARYIGVDVDVRLLRWCQENIAAGDQRFSFVRSDARNAMYNPSGMIMDRATIAVETAAASFSFATSVFTHLCAGEASAYIAELSRATRVGGRVLVTAFLIDEGRRQLVTDGRTRGTFAPLDDATWTTDPALPESVVGFTQETLLRWATDAGLKLRYLLPGNWSGREGGYSFQDILVFDRVRG